MRITIESEERATITAPQAPAAPSGQGLEAVNAGPPAASLFQTAAAGATAATLREGIDAGGPPQELVERLKQTPSPSMTSREEANDAGAAPGE